MWVVWAHFSASDFRTEEFIKKLAVSGITKGYEPLLKNRDRTFIEKHQRSASSALCQFTVGSILHLQRKSGSTGRTAAC